MWLLTKDVHFECFTLFSSRFAPLLLGTGPGSGQLCMLCCSAMHATHTYICIMVDILPGIHTCGRLDSVSSDGCVDGCVDGCLDGSRS